MAKWTPWLPAFGLYKLRGSQSGSSWGCSSEFGGFSGGVHVHVTH